MKKRILLSVILIILGFGLTFAGFVFVLLDPYIFNWESYQRAFYLEISIGVIVIAHVISYTSDAMKKLFNE